MRDNKIDKMKFIKFKKIPFDDLKKKLSELCVSEGIVLSNMVMDALISSCDGNIRECIDGLSTIKNSGSLKDVLEKYFRSTFIIFSKKDPKHNVIHTYGSIICCKTKKCNRCDGLLHNEVFNGIWRFICDKCKFQYSYTKITGDKN